MDTLKTTLRKTYCYIHGQTELCPKDTYVCFECGHAYISAGEIIDEHLLSMKEVGATGSAKKFARSFCPLCLHDWVG